jgi:mitogen-activated protein kinase kinase
VWSLGISLVELALGRFPFSDAPDDDDDLEDPDATLPLSTQRPNMKTEKPKSEGVSLGGGGMTMSILDLLQHIVNEPAPRLTKGRYPIEAEDFVAGCLDKDPETRFAPKRLLVRFL